MANKEKKTSKKDKKKAKDSKELRYYRVTEDHDGALVCNCPEFDKTGKPCVEILAARLQIEFGPSKAYFGLPTAADSEDDNVLPAKAKSKGKKQRAGSGPGRRGQRAQADHRVEEVHDAFLERVEKGWNPFGDDPDFTDTEDEGQPQRKKSKSENKDDEAVGSKVTPGRPAATTPLHAGRSSASPAKFSNKRGPKGKAHNSLLPPLPLSAKEALLKPITEVNNPSDDESPKLPRGKFPAMNKSTLKKKAQYIERLTQFDFPEEDLDILDIDFKRWLSDAYKLRQDEASEMATLLEALSLELKDGVIILGPTYEQEAELLKQADWLISDEEPINASGALLFPEGSVLKQAWLHSQRVPPTQMLLFHRDPRRDHWLLFHANLTTGEIMCHEPLSQHGEESIDVRPIVLIAKFFKPNRSGNKPMFDDLDDRYKVFIHDIQIDGASCGFWMVSIALLIICGIKISRSSIEILKVLGVENVKEHWKCLLTSWRVEEKGLGTEPVNNLLMYWDYQFDSKTKIIARRPEWLSRFDPEGIIRSLTQTQTHTPLSPLYPEAGRHLMPSEQEAEKAAETLRGVFTEQGNDSYVDFQKERLKAEDLKRFLTFEGRGAMANDEVVNMFVAVLNYSPDEPIGGKRPHFGSLFELGPPSRKFLIMTSFFYSKLKELLAAENPDTGSAEKAKEIKERVCRWVKANFDVVRHFLIPVNEPEHVHWILIELDYTIKAILIYDSWPSKGSNKSKTDLEDVQSRYPIPLALAVLATQILSTVSLGLLPAISQEWSIRAVPIPPQDNVIDCGFFMIMVIMHLVHWGQVHHPNCPRPILNISATTMRRTRVILAYGLLQWLEASNAPRVSQSDSHVEQKLLLQGPGSSSSAVISPEKLKPVDFEAAVPESGLSDKSEIVPNDHFLPIEPPAPALQEDTMNEQSMQIPTGILSTTTPEASSNSPTFSPVPSSVDGEDEELTGDLLALDNAAQTSANLLSPVPSSVDGEGEELTGDPLALGNAAQTSPPPNEEIVVRSSSLPSLTPTPSPPSAHPTPRPRRGRSRKAAAK